MIGAGTTGSSIAYFLTQRGLRPVVFEKTRAAGGPSGASAGMCRAALRPSPRSSTWRKLGLRVPRRHEGAHGLPVGLLACRATSSSAAGAREPRSAASTRRCASAASRSSCAASTASSSSSRACARDDLAIGCYEPTGGHAQPLFVADGFVRAAERDGATLRLGTRVTRLRPDGQGWTLWLGDGTRASAEVVIVACGPWANKLTRGLGGVVPLALSRGQAGRFRPPARVRPARARSSPTTCTSSGSSPRATTATTSIGGRGGRLDRSPHKRPTGQAGADDSMLETFAGELAHRFPGMAGGVWRGSWSSFYDFTPDGNPVIDQFPGRPSLITATGMSGHCFKLAPSLGLGTAELVVDGVVRSFDWSVFAYGRFARRGDRGRRRVAGPDDRRRAARRRRGLALPRGGRRRQAARAGRRPPARGARRSRRSRRRRSAIA